MAKKVSKLTDILSQKTIQKIQDKFAEVLGISLATYDTKGKKITKTSNASKFYKAFIEDNPIIQPLDRKDISQAIKACLEKRESHTFKSYSNATSFIVPIIINEKPLAVFVGGRIRTGNPDLKLCRHEADENKFNFDEFLELYLELPLFSEQEIGSITRLLRTVANTMSMISLSDSQSKEKLEEVSYLNKLLEEEIEIRNIALEKSEKKYRGIVENALEIICTIDMDGLIISMNKTGEKYIGMPKEQIVGTHFSRYIHPNGLSKIRKAFEEINRGERDTLVDLQYRGAMSNEEFAINAKANKDAQGKATELECIIRRVSKEAKLERDLKKAEEKYKELVNAVPDCIYACDMEGNFMNINLAGCKMLGYAKEELIGRNIKENYSNPSDRDGFIKEILRKGYYHGFVTKLKHKSGRSFYIETYSNLIKDKNGNPIAVEGVFRDVTTRIKLSQKLQESEKKFRAIFDNSFDPIILIDREGKILDHNRKAERIFGIKAKNNIKDILEENTEKIIKNADKKGFFNLPIFPYSKGKQSYHFSIGISELNLDDKVLFQIIFNDIGQILHEKNKIDKPTSRKKIKTV